MKEEVFMILSQDDNSAIPIPVIFMFVSGIPVIVNENTHQGLELVNDASYTAPDIILNKVQPGYHISPTILSSASVRQLGSYYQRKRLETSTSSVCHPTPSS